MKLQRIKLHNIGQFDQLTIHFSPSSSAQMHVILGAQNSGKTTILKHIFQALSWFSHRHKEPRGSGIMIADSDIRQDANTASIFIEVSYPSELGNIINETYTPSRADYLCRWKIEKNRQTTSPSMNLGTSELGELELLVRRYQNQSRVDPLFSTPCIAYYPVERFVYEANLQGKNLNATLSPLHNAYDLTAVNFTTFSKFFEWLREIYDVENAQAAKLFKQYLDPQHRFDHQQNFDQTLSAIEQAYRLSSQRCMSSLRQALQQVIPEVSDLELEYSPKLNLLIKHQSKFSAFLQLPQSTRIWIGLIGDLVRRLSLLNPNSLYPCAEGEGIVLIDHIDLLMDDAHLKKILPRLKLAFPRLQFIVSSLSDALIEDMQDIHCYQLQAQKIYPIDVNQHHINLQKIYDDLMANSSLSHLDTPINTDSIINTETSATLAPTSLSFDHLSYDQILHAIQSFSPVELERLITQLKQPDFKENLK